jgi:hypothetical protein
MLNIQGDWFIVSMNVGKGKLPRSGLVLRMIIHNRNNFQTPLFVGDSDNQHRSDFPLPHLRISEGKLLKKASAAILAFYNE